MNKLSKFLGVTKRQLALRLLARVHCGLVAGILFALLFGVLNHFRLTNHSVYAAFFRGLLFAVPAELSYEFVRRTKALWQFLLISVLLCGLSFLLTGHAGGVVLTALLCLFRVRARLAEEDEGPTRSLFDFPTYPFLFLFAAAFADSALTAYPPLQKLSIVSAVCYFLLCMAYKGLERVDDYLTLNQAMHNLPARRIQRLAGVAVLLWVALAAVLLVPALGARGDVVFTIPEITRDRVQAEAIEPAGQGPSGDMASYLALLAQGEEGWQIPPWVMELIFGVISVAALLALAVAVFLGIRKLLRDYRRSYTDNRDLVQHLDSSEDPGGSDSRSSVRGRRLPVWDRSPNATIRRRYRRVILKAGKETPRRCLTPAELESWAGVESPRLHQLYEKARYGQEACTAAEAKEAGTLAR